LALGCFAAISIWPPPNSPATSADPQFADPAAPLAPSDSRKLSREIEIYYGKTGVLMERWREGLETFTYGKRLALLILVTSSLSAGACFLLSQRI
jgi:hypothetical protein